MKKKNITIDDLAIMVGKGFESVDKRFDLVDKRFDLVDKRLDKIEKLIIADHRQRIEKLEEEMKELKNLLAV
jgi:archaellum component FlaC